MAKRNSRGRILGSIAEDSGVGKREDKRHTSGAEAQSNLIGFIPGMNPRPTARLSFSAGGDGPGLKAGGCCAVFSGLKATAPSGGNKGGENGRTAILP